MVRGYITQYQASGRSVMCGSNQTINFGELCLERRMKSGTSGNTPDKKGACNVTAVMILFASISPGKDGSSRMSFLGAPASRVLDGSSLDFKTRGSIAAPPSWFRKLSLLARRIKVTEKMELR